MEMKPGYKKTEVGVIPEDWYVCELRNLSKIITGPFGTLLKASEYTDSDGVPQISVGEIGDGYFRVGQSTSRIPKEVTNRIPKYLLRTNDIVFARKGAVDRSSLVTEKEDGWFLGSDGICVRPTENYQSSYLAAQLRSPLVKSWLLQNAIGTTMPSLNQNILGRLQVPIAPIAEQRAVATALSDMDTLLDGLDRLIAKKRAIKQSIMQQLLTGQTRLPGFSGEWEVRRLGDICEISMGRTPARLNTAMWGRGHVWLSIADMNGKFVSGSKEEITDLAASEMTPVATGTLMMSFKLSIGRLCFAGCDLYTNEAICAFNKPNANPEYLYYALSRIDFSLYGKQAVKGYTLNKNSLSLVEVNLPPAEEQTAIATILTDMDTEITALETRRTKSRALKQAMMQELLTGRTRLVTPDENSDEEAVAQTEGRKPNVHFLRSVLAAEIIDQLHDQPTFGHVKFEKMMFLAEHLCQVDTGSTYRRKAAGPYDNRALRSIDGQLQRQKWFEARKQHGRYQYVPLAKRGGHRPYFERHFSEIVETLENILRTFKTAKTEQCEIVATLLAAWSDLLREKGTVSDEMIVHEVLHNWHEAKQRIPVDRWLKALVWMREKGFVPKGVTLP